MWELKEPKAVKLIIGILAADKRCLEAAVEAVTNQFGEADLVSDVWPFDQTDYYKNQTGDHILKQFVSIEELINPGSLAEIKHKTNKLEQKLAEQLQTELPRPLNFDPGLVEPSKLVLATTKNYAHRIYIGKHIYAEVTLFFDKGRWQSFQYTYPDYKQGHYFDFLDKVRAKLLEQLKS